MIKKCLFTLVLLLNSSVFAAGYNLSLNESNELVASRTDDVEEILLLDQLLQRGGNIALHVVGDTIEGELLGFLYRVMNNTDFSLDKLMLLGDDLSMIQEQFPRLRCKDLPIVNIVKPIINVRGPSYQVQRTAAYSKWYGKISTQDFKKVNQMLDDAANYGRFAAPKDCKNFVWEMRTRTAINGIRIYYRIMHLNGNATLILLLGGDKSSENNQEGDIATAKVLAATFG